MNKEELNELEKIHLRQEKNLLVFSQVASYLNNAPCTITSELIKEITDNNKDLEEYAYATFLADLFTDDEELANELFREYYIKSVKQLDESEYYKNPYYKNINIPNKQVGKWTLGSQEYQPYEAFIRDDIIINEYTEIPSIGYFDKKFAFPTVFENGVEWMAIKPNEIETMKQAISEASGNVLVYGLGLGYYAYMISLKNEVKSITIIERDESVIKLFYEHILPQFEYKDKINVLKYDAFEYAQNEAKKHEYNYVFVDLWHDVSDGTELYMRMKRLEEYLPNAKFSYWIERSILSAIRVPMLDSLYKSTVNGIKPHTVQEIKTAISDEYIKKLIKGE